MPYTDEELQSLYGNLSNVDYSQPAVQNPSEQQTQPEVPYKLGKQILNIVPKAVNSIVGGAIGLGQMFEPDLQVSEADLAPYKNPFPSFDVGQDTGIKDVILNRVAPDIAGWMIPYEGILKGATTLGNVGKFSELPRLARIVTEGLAQGTANTLTASPEDQAQTGFMGAASGILQQALPRWQRLLPLAAVSAVGTSGNPLGTTLNTAFNLLPEHARITDPVLAPSNLSEIAKTVQSFSPVDIGNDIHNVSPYEGLEPHDAFSQIYRDPNLQLNHFPELQIPTETQPQSLSGLSLEGVKYEQPNLHPLLDLQGEILNPNEKFKLIDNPEIAGVPQNDPRLPLFDWRNEQVKAEQPLALPNAILPDLAEQIRNPKLNLTPKFELPDVSHLLPPENPLAPLNKAIQDVSISLTHNVDLADANKSIADAIEATKAKPKTEVQAPVESKSISSSVDKIREAYKAVQEKDPHGFPDISISDLMKEVGIKNVKEGHALIQQLHKAGEIQLAGGDWSLASKAERKWGYIIPGSKDERPYLMMKFEPKTELPQVMTPSGDFLDIKPRMEGPHIISTVLDEGEGQYLAGDKWNAPHQKGKGNIFESNIENATGQGKSAFLIKDEQGNIRVTQDRKEAAKIAEIAGQRKAETIGSEALQSEHLTDPISKEPKSVEQSIAKEKTKDISDLTSAKQLQAKIDDHLEAIKFAKEEMASTGDPSFAAEIRARQNTVAKMRQRMNGEGGFASVDTQIALAAAGIAGLVAYQQSKGDVGTTIAAALVVAGLGVGGVKAIQRLRELKGPELKPLSTKIANETVKEKIKQLAIDTTKNKANLAVGGRGGVWASANQMASGLLGLHNLKEVFDNAKVLADGFVAYEIEKLQKALDQVKRIQPTEAFAQATQQYIRGQLGNPVEVRQILNDGNSILSGEGGAWAKLTTEEKSKYPEKWMFLEDPKNTNTKGPGVEIWHVTNDVKQQLLELQNSKLEQLATTPEDLAYAKFAQTFRSTTDNLMQVYHDALPPGMQRNKMVGTMGQWVTRSHAVITDPSVYPTEIAIQNAMDKLGLMKEKDFFSSVAATGAPEGKNNTAVQWMGNTYYVSPSEAQEFKFLHTPESLRGEVRDYIAEIKKVGALQKQGAIAMDSEQFRSSLFSGRKELDLVSQALLETHNTSMEIIQNTINKIVPAAQVGHFMQDAIKMVNPDTGYKIAMDNLEYNKSISDLRSIIDNPSSDSRLVREAKNKYQELVSYSKMPKDTRYGLTDEMYVSQALKTKIQGFDGTPFGFLDNSIGRSLHWFNQYFKTTHLTLSPASIARQIFQAPLMMIMGNVRDFESIASAFRGYMDRSQGVGKWMTENGVFSSSQLHGDLNVTLEDVLNGSLDQSIWGRVKQGIRGAHKLFASPDDVVRASVFMNEAKRAAKDLGVPLESFDSRVADRARQFMLRRAINFSNLPLYVKVGREIPFVNIFLAYTHEIARISKNMAVDAAHGDIQAGAALAGMSALPFILQRSFESQLSTEDQKQWNQAKDLVSDYSRPRFKLPLGKDKNGSFSYLDITSVLPFNDYQMMARSVFNGDPKGFLDVNPAFGLDKSPFFTTLVPQITGENEHTGRKFRGLGDRATDILQQLLPPLTPGIGYEYQKDVPESLGGNLGVTNLKNARTNTSIGAFLRNFTGIDFTQLNPDVATKNFVADAKEQIANEKQYLYDILKTNGLSDDAKKRATEKFVESINQITQEMQAKLQLQSK